MNIYPPLRGGFLIQTIIMEPTFLPTIRTLSKPLISLYTRDVIERILEKVDKKYHKNLDNVFKSSKFVTLTNTSNGDDLSFDVRDGLLIISNNKINIQYVL